MQSPFQLLAGERARKHDSWEEVGTLPFYRIYWLAADGHIKGAENLDCASDEQAIAAASQRMGEYPAMEVWLGTRRVAQLGAPVEVPTGSAESDSRGPLLIRRAAATIRKSERLLAQQTEAAEAARRTVRNSQELRSRIAKRKSDTKQEP